MSEPTHFLIFMGVSAKHVLLKPSWEADRTTSTTTYPHASKTGVVHGLPMPTPVFVFHSTTARTHRGARPGKKGRSPGCSQTISKVKQMFITDNTTTSKTVKISAPFRLNTAQRKVMANGQLLNIASPSGRQQGDYLYSATVTLLREDAAVYTTAPSWASVEVE